MMIQTIEVLLGNPFFAAVLQFLHLICATAVLGGLLFFRLVFIPYADTQGDKFTDARRYARRRSRGWLWFLLGMLGLTGGVLWVIRTPLADGKAHLLLLLKFVLMLLMTVLLLIQTLPTKRLSLAKRNVPFYSTLAILLGILCLLIAVFLQAHLALLFRAAVRSGLVVF